jgi:hypothetical protein
MVWAGIWLGGRTGLVIIERDPDSRIGRGYTTNSYLDVLEEGFLPYYQPETIFQQDNARIHTSLGA